VRLTSAGWALDEFVAPFIEGLKGLEAAISTRGFGGTLRVQTASLLLKDLLPHWARRLARARPDIVLEVKVAPDDLLSGACDLILDHLPAPPRGVSTKEVARLFWFLALPKAHRLGRKAKVKLQKLRNESFVVYNEDISARQLQLSALREAGVVPMRFVGAGSAEAILGFVAAGPGAALVPWPDPRGPKIAGVAVHRLRVKGSVFPVHAAWRTSLPADPLIEAALAALPDQARGTSSSS